MNLDSITTCIGYAKGLEGLTIYTYTYDVNVNLPAPNILYHDAASLMGRAQGCHFLFLRAFLIKNKVSYQQRRDQRVQGVLFGAIG